MFRIILRSKIHWATVTEIKLNYEGSITIDEELIKEVGFLPGERVEVFNVNNGARFATYVIPGKAGSGTICLNGAAARLAEVGDKLNRLLCFSHRRGSEKYEAKDCSTG